MDGWQKYDFQIVTALRLSPPLCFGYSRLAKVGFVLLPAKGILCFFFCNALKINFLCFLTL
jgi:hypothetical protein